MRRRMAWCQEIAPDVWAEPDVKDVIRAEIVERSRELAESEDMMLDEGSVVMTGESVHEFTSEEGESFEMVVTQWEAYAESVYESA